MIMILKTTIIIIIAMIMVYSGFPNREFGSSSRIYFFKHNISL